MRMVSILAGSMPADFMLAIILPAVGCTCPPVPLSHRTVLPPFLTTTTVNGIETERGCHSGGNDEIATRQVEHGPSPRGKSKARPARRAPTGPRLAVLAVYSRLKSLWEREPITSA